MEPFNLLAEEKESKEQTEIMKLRSHLRDSGLKSQRRDFIQICAGSARLIQSRDGWAQPDQQRTDQTLALPKPRMLIGCLFLTRPLNSIRGGENGEDLLHVLGCRSHIQPQWSPGTSSSWAHTWGRMPQYQSWCDSDPPPPPPPAARGHVYWCK